MFSPKTSAAIHRFYERTHHTFLSAGNGYPVNSIHTRCMSGFPATAFSTRSSSLASAERAARQCADCKRRQEYNRQLSPQRAAKGLRPHCLMRRSGVCLRAMCLWKRFERTTYAAQPRWHSTASTVFKKQACSMVLLCPCKNYGCAGNNTPGTALFVSQETLTLIVFHFPLLYRSNTNSERKSWSATNAIHAPGRPQCSK